MVSSSILLRCVTVHYISAILVHHPIMLSITASMLNSLL